MLTKAKHNITERDYLMRAVYCMLIVSFVLFSALCIYLHFLPTYNSPIIYTYTEKKKHHFFIAVVTAGKLRNAIEYSFTHWFKDLTEQNLILDVRYFGDGILNTNITNLSYTIVKDKKDKSLHHLCGKLRSALNFFVYNTPADWFIRVCEDTVINPKTFPNFAADLSRFNPRQDFVVQGACVAKEKDTYLQGGSGFVFSRKAAEDLLNSFDEFQSFCNIRKSDDVVMGKYLLNKTTPYNITSRFFLGHQVSSTSYNDIMDNLSSIEECTVPVSKRGCRPFYTKLKDVTFWHDRVPFDQFAEKITEIRRKTPDKLMFSVKRINPLLCFANEDTVEGYYQDSIGTATMKVREADTSIAYKTGTVNTLSSAVLLALMEEACVNALDLPNLVCHNSSVAYGIQMKHIRPSPVGATLTATAKIKNIDLRGVHFDIEAFDEAGLVGKGIHTRVFVQQDEFERKCYDKARNLLLN